MPVRKNNYLHALCSTCEQLLSTWDYEDALANVVEHAARCLHAKGSSIRLLDKTGTQLEIAATHGLSKSYLKKGPIEIDRSPLDQSVMSGNVVYLANAAQDDRFQYPQEAKKEGIQSVLCVPLGLGANRIGVLRIYTGQKRRFGDEEVMLIKTFATQSAAIIRHARSHKRFKRISEIGRAITSKLNRTDVLQEVCRHATMDMAAKGASLIMMNEATDQLEVIAAHGINEYQLQQDHLHQDAALKQCLKNGREVVIENAARDPKVYNPEFIKKEGIRSIYCGALKIKGKVRGVLKIYMMYNYITHQEDLEFLTILGDFGMIAFENARLYEHVRKDYDDLSKDVWKWYGWGERAPQL